MTPDPLISTLIDLVQAIDLPDFKLILGGGFGLCLKQLHLQRNPGVPTLFPGDLWPYPRATEDLDLFLRLMERYDCANLPELGLYYELNEGGISATKRRGQVTSTLRLQLRYFNALNLYDWLGLAKNLLHLVTPYRTLQAVKRRLYAPGAGH